MPGLGFWGVKTKYLFFSNIGGSSSSVVVSNNYNIITLITFSTKLGIDMLFWRLKMLLTILRISSKKLVSNPGSDAVGCS
jgi:polyferredoxin